MNKDFIKELDVLIWKFLKIADELTHKFSYYVRFIGIRKVTSDMISANFLYEYGYPVAPKMQQIDIPIEKFNNIDDIVTEIYNSEPI